MGYPFFLHRLAVTLLPVPSQSLLVWPRSELSQRGHGTWTSVACSVAQIAFLQLVLVLSLSSTLGVLPWHLKGANVIDCACHVCLLAMVLLAAFFAEDKYLTEVANLWLIVAILMLCFLPIGLGVAGLKAAQKSNKKSSNILFAITSRVQAPRGAF